MTEEQVDRLVLQTGEDNATSLAYDVCPDELRALATAARALDRAFKKIRVHFPDANLYSASDGMNLLLGASHSDTTKGETQQQRVVHIDNWPGMVYLSGGDW